MRKTLIAICMLALAGCATTAPVQMYRAQGQADAWHISGTLDEVTEELNIMINGQTALTGKLSIWNGTGSVSGLYQGRPITTTCRPANNRRECQVIIGAELAATLIF